MLSFLILILSRHVVEILRVQVQTTAIKQVTCNFWFLSAYKRYAYTIMQSIRLY